MIWILALFLVSCSAPIDAWLENDSLDFDDSLLISFEKEVFVHEYCGVPGFLLHYDRGAHRYVTNGCDEPVLRRVDHLVVDLDMLRQLSGHPIEGDYQFKVIYGRSNIREANVFFTVSLKSPDSNKGGLEQTSPKNMSAN